MTQLVRSGEGIREVGDAETAADHGCILASKSVCKADARTDVAVTCLHTGSTTHSIHAGIDEHQLRIVEVGHLIILLHVRGEDVIPHTEVQRKTRRNFPVILRVSGILLIGDVVRHLQEVSTASIREAQQNAGKT